MAHQVPTADEDRGATAGGRTLTELLTSWEGRGFSGQFGSEEDSKVTCFTCHVTSAAGDVAVYGLCRLEGASDPADMLMLVALECPSCATKGTMTCTYGPEATGIDNDVLAALSSV